MRLYIIRHGQTDRDVEGRIQGRQGIPLNAAGHNQAEMLARGMGKRPVTAIYSSPQIRVMETVETPVRAQGVTVISVPKLVKTGYGDWEGRTASDVLVKERELYEEWWQRPAAVAPPGGGALDQVDVRCKKVRERMKGETKGDTVVVAHEETLAHFIVHLLEGQLDAAEILVGNASIATIEYDPVIGQCNFVGLNDRSHLM